MEITFQLEKQRRRKGRMVRAAITKTAPRIPRISRLMALAIRFEGLFQQQDGLTQANLAEFGGVTRSRLTQIMHLVHLAPDIQEELLFLPSSSRIVERTLRPIVRLVRWDEQRKLFATATASLTDRAL